jgi:hypothetical protein
MVLFAQLPVQLGKFLFKIRACRRTRTAADRGVAEDGREFERYHADRPCPEPEWLATNPWRSLDGISSPHLENELANVRWDFGRLPRDNRLGNQRGAKG